MWLHEGSVPHYLMHCRRVDKKAGDEKASLRLFLINLVIYSD